MIDRCGRKIDYLRISVTDRCSLRCIYCMPEKGLKLVDRSLLLREEEILRVAGIMAEMGICKIKLTGGEPLLHRRLPELAGEIKKIPGIRKVTVTTNGILLKEQMARLAAAGVDGINVSLDTLDRECFRRITRRDLLEKAVEGIRSALRYPEISLKINCVSIFGRVGFHHIRLIFINGICQFPTISSALKNTDTLCPESIHHTISGNRKHDGNFTVSGWSYIHIISIDLRTCACKRRDRSCCEENTHEQKAHKTLGLFH